MRLRKLDADRWAHAYLHLLSLGGGGEAEEGAGSLELLLVCRWLGQGHDSQGPLWEENWLPPMVNVVWIA